MYCLETEAHRSDNICLPYLNNYKFDQLYYYYYDRMQSKNAEYTGNTGYLLTWPIVEGVIAVIESWIYREMPCEGTQCQCDRGARYQEDPCHICGATSGSASRDLLHVYNLLREIVNFIAERGPENQ